MDPDARDCSRLLSVPLQPVHMKQTRAQLDRTSFPRISCGCDEEYRDTRPTRRCRQGFIKLEMNETGEGWRRVRLLAITPELVDRGGVRGSMMTRIRARKVFFFFWAVLRDSAYRWRGETQQDPVCRPWTSGKS